LESIFPHSVIDIKPALIKILSLFKNTRLIVTDNERALCSMLIKSMLETHFNIEHKTVPPFHSNSNGQVERFHSTLAEIARCVVLEYKVPDPVEAILLANRKYNTSYHSITEYCPLDVFHSLSQDILNEVSEKIEIAQRNTLRYHNQNKKHRIFRPGDVVFVKTTRPVGNKLTKLYKRMI